MLIGRRGFLASLSVLAITTLKRTPLPVLHGDGIGDDTDAIQALSNGQPVWDAREGQVLDQPVLHARHLLISRTIQLNPTSVFRITNSVISPTRGMPNSPAFRLA
jgi:hypothetical protein